MQCYIVDFMGRKKLVELSQALTPEARYDGGSVEAARASAEAANEAMGRLLAMLVRKGKITLDEAREASGVYADIELK